MIKISNRLKTISSYIDNKDRVIDVGCDHAYLSIYLKQNKDIYIIATDIVEDAIKNAKQNIKKHQLESKIKIECCDGLSNIKKTDKINTIILSGLGYQKIEKILLDYKDIDNINKLIIQSNNYPSKIRKLLTKKNFYIFDEKLIKENNIIYTILVFKKGYKKYSKRQISLGPILILKKEKLFIEQVKSKIKTNENILKNMPNKYVLKRIKLLIKQKNLKKELNNKNLT